MRFQGQMSLFGYRLAPGLAGLPLIDGMQRPHRAKVFFGRNSGYARIQIMECSHLTPWRTDRTADYEGESQMRKQVQFPAPDNTGQQIRFNRPIRQIRDSGKDEEDSGRNECRPFPPRPGIANIDHIADEEQAKNIPFQMMD
jgi:hypothetical protein